MSKQIRKANNDSYTNPISYQTGDLLLVKNECKHKLSNVYFGPYQVIEDLNPNVKILRNGKVEIIHKNRTKLYVKE